MFPFSNIFSLKSRTGLLSTIIFFFNINLYGVTSYQVNVGAWALVEEWGQCRMVTNNTAQGPLFVPTKTAAEWSNFCASSTPGVAIDMRCCYPWGGSAPSGGNSVAFLYAALNYPSDCNSYSEVRNCAASGVLSGSYLNPSCTQYCNASMYSSCYFYEYAYACSQFSAVWCNGAGQSVASSFIVEANSPYCGGGYDKYYVTCNSPGTIKCDGSCSF